MSEKEIEKLKQELHNNVKTYIPKIRTGEQLERENYLLCFRSKSQLASMLIDAEEKIEKAIGYINKNSVLFAELHKQGNYFINCNADKLLEILKGEENVKEDKTTI